MIRTIFPCLLLLAVAGCGSKEPAAQTQTASVSFSDGNATADTSDNGAQTVAISVPGFSAKLAVPGLEIGGRSMSIDGIPFHEGTRLAGMNISGAAGDGSGGEGHGAVEMRFTDPAAPDAVLAYYRQAARTGGWTEVPPAAGQQFAATKPQDQGSEHLAIQVSAATAGSAGRFLVTGG